MWIDGRCVRSGLTSGPVLEQVDDGAERCSNTRADGPPHPLAFEATAAIADNACTKHGGDADQQRTEHQGKRER